MYTVIKPQSFEEFRKSIKSDGKNVILRSSDTKLVRKTLEYGKFLAVIGFEGNEKRSLRQINSGFNEILGRIASKNSVAIGFDINDISNLPKKEKAELLSKWMQNIRISRKTKVRLLILNSKDKIDTNNLLLSLGASTKQVKEALIL